MCEKLINYYYLVNNRINIKKKKNRKYKNYSKVHEIVKWLQWVINK